jgi:hypothetical protein
MKPTLSPGLLRAVYYIVGGGLVALAHSALVPQPWAQMVGELGGAIALYAKTARILGDVPLQELPLSVQESVRPPKLP